MQRPLHLRTARCPIPMRKDARNHPDWKSSAQADPQLSIFDLGICRLLGHTRIHGALMPSSVAIVLELVAQERAVGLPDSGGGDYAMQSQAPRRAAGARRQQRHSSDPAKSMMAL